jgi:hypothetical protein
MPLGFPPGVIYAVLHWINEARDDYYALMRADDDGMAQP